MHTLECLIKSAFSDLIGPPDLCLKYEAYEEALTGVPWDALDIDVVLDYWTALTGLPDHGFRYYLPAWLLASLSGRPNADEAASTVLFNLGEEYREKRITGLTHAQRCVVAQWVKWAMETPPNVYDGSFQEAVELCGFWTQYLPPGVTITIQRDYFVECWETDKDD